MILLVLFNLSDYRSVLFCPFSDVIFLWNSVIQLNLSMCSARGIDTGFWIV